MDRVPEPTLIIEGALSKQQPEKSFLKISYIIKRGKMFFDQHL